MRLVTRSILFLALFLPFAAGQAGAASIVREPDLKPCRAKLRELIGQIEKKQIQVGQALGKLRTRTFTEKDPRQRAFWHYAYGTALMEWLDQRAEAEREFKAALKLLPDFPHCWGRLATLSALNNNLKSAHKLIDEALRLDPRYVKALAFKAGLYFQEDRLFKALKLYKRAYDISPEPMTCIGLAQIYVSLYRQEFNEKEKQKLYKSAVNYGGACLVLDAKSGNAHILLGNIHLECAGLDKPGRIDMAKVDKAEETFEKAYNSQIPDNNKVRALSELFNLHMRTRQYDKAVRDLERCLLPEFKEIVKGPRRDDVKAKLKSLKEDGGYAQAKWQIKRMVQILEAKGATAADRTAAVRALLGFLQDPQVVKLEQFKDLRVTVFHAVVRALLHAPPSVTVEILRWFQVRFRDPHLLRVLVHFVYPNDDAKRTPEVRLEAIRTIAEVGETAAIPTLYYCLRDEPGEILRAVESALARVCEVRSLVGGGLGPLNKAQKKLARTAWREYFHGDEGTDLLIAAIKGLRKVLDMDPGFNRSQQTKPVADHLVWTVLLDDDIQWDAWIAGYEFLKDYLGKDFRPVNLRKQPVAKGERQKIVAEIVKFMGGEKQGLQPPPKKPDEDD